MPLSFGNLALFVYPQERVAQIAVKHGQGRLVGHVQISPPFGLRHFCEVYESIIPVCNLRVVEYPHLIPPNELPIARRPSPMVIDLSSGFMESRKAAIVLRPPFG